MSSKPFLSICIPAYNKSDRLRKNITSLLDACDDEIEIVVVDNVSSENLEDVCNSFNDPRISYYRNEKPVAATVNWFRSIRLAKGQWALLMMDRDLINGKGIPAVVEALKNNRAFGAAKVGFLQNCGDEAYEKNPKFEGCKKYPAKEIETLLTLNKDTHPTGKIYNKEYLELSEAYENAIAQKPRVMENMYLLFDPVWNYGLLSIRMTDRVCYTPTSRYMKTYKSGWQVSETKFMKVHPYTPAGFTQRVREDLEEMSKLNLSLEEKKELCVQAYNGYLKRKFIGLISIPKKNHVWTHYDNLKYEYRTGKERKRIASEFCDAYKEMVKLFFGDVAEDVLAEIKPIRIDWLTYIKPTIRTMKSAIVQSLVIEPR